MATRSIKGALGRLLSVREGRNVVESKTRQAKNVLKHICIAKATTGHEHDVHVAKAMRLHKRYNGMLAREINIPEAQAEKEKRIKDKFAVKA